MAVLEVCALQTGGGTENWDKVECLVVCLVVCLVECLVVCLVE